MSDDTPIEPVDFVYGVKVIDFGEARVARGLARRTPSTCRHLKMTYSEPERRIWCGDCKSTVDNFDAFKVLVEYQASALGRLNRIKEEVAEAEGKALHLISTKNLEKLWRGGRLTPQCPHCGGGLLADDFRHLQGGISTAIEIQRRKNLKKPT